LNILSFDTETRGLDWWDPAQQAFLITYSDADSDYVVRPDDDAAMQAFLDRLEQTDVLVAHNLPFDVHQVRETYGIDLLTTGHELWDTEIMARVLYPKGQLGGPSTYRLKSLSRIYLRDDAGDAEAEIKKMAKAIGLRTIKQNGAYYEVWRAYPDVMENYAMEDTRLTYDLFVKFKEELAERSDLHRVMELERRVAPILIRAEQRGIALDPRKVDEMHAEQVAKRDEAASELEAEGVPIGEEGVEEALIEALQSHGVPLYRKTKTGALSTNNFALQEFENEFPIIGLLQRYRAAAKLVSTYYGPMQGRRVLHTSFQAIGAWTSRMSSRRPNLQNVPKAARSVIVPRKGYAFIVSDYDAIEMRLLAYYLGNEEYRELVEMSDPHAWMASEIHGGLPSEFSKGGPNDDRRSSAKNSLFAICYGAGAPRITDMNNLPPGTRYRKGDYAVEQGWKRVGDYKYEPARRLIANIKAAIPGFKKLTARIDAKIKAKGYVNTLWGRVQPVGKDKSYVGLNALIQGSAAEIMKQGLVNVAEALEDFDAHVLLVVHDEVVVECRKRQARQVQELVEQAMIDAFPLEPSLAVTSAVVTTSYAEAK
jgi:DNA polymerase I